LQISVLEHPLAPYRSFADGEIEAMGSDPSTDQLMTTMNNQWNDDIFREFIRLRDAMRAAKKEKNYQCVLSFGMSILDLDMRAGFLKIATHAFLKDMAEACIKLGDTTLASKYLIAAMEKLQEQQTTATGWRKEIETIKRRLEKLQASCAQSITP
jgi:hypothetical protein